MKRDVIRDYSNRVIGYIETDNQGNQVAKDFYQRILGRYDARRNETSDFHAKVLARGNILAALIYAEDEKQRQEQANRLKRKKKK